MEHLKNLLIGVGNVLTAFGTTPQYRYPQIGDRVADMRNVRTDGLKVAKRLGLKTAQALKETHGKVDNRAIARQGQASDGVGTRV
jgi:hypothetical protein